MEENGRALLALAEEATKTKGEPPARTVKVKPTLHIPENLSVEGGADVRTSQRPFFSRCIVQGDGYPLVAVVNPTYRTSILATQVLGKRVGLAPPGRLSGSAGETAIITTPLGLLAKQDSEDT